MPKLDDYNRRAPEYKPGDLVQVKRHTEWARLTDSHGWEKSSGLSRRACL